MEEGVLRRHPASGPAAGKQSCSLGETDDGQDRKTEEPQGSARRFPSWHDGRRAARLYVSLPGMERATAERLIEATHQVCPYSRATHGNIAVETTLV